MADQGILEAAKSGFLPGTFVGFAVSSSRAFLSARQHAEAELLSLKNPALRPPSPLSTIASTTAQYAALGAVYMGVGATAAQMRGRHDMWNGVCGALVSGALVGVRAKSMYIAGGAMASLVVATASLDLLGGHIGPADNDPILARRRAMYQE